MRRLVVTLVFLFALPACGGEAPELTPTPSSSSDSTPGNVTAETSDGADWRSYADPGDAEWDIQDLDDARWVAVSADLGCIGRSLHGDPDAHREALRRVLAHHATTSDAVMSYGVAVNEAPERARTLAPQVAERVQTCR